MKGELVYVNKSRTAWHLREGFALVELLVIVVIVAILATFAAMQQNTPGDNTIWYQAQRLARDLRHVQVLTSTYGKPLQVTATGSGYSVSCVTSGAAPCDVSPIIDPSTGNPFTVNLQYGVGLAVTGANPASFDNQGRPLNGSAVSTTTTSYTLTVNGTSVVVAVAPITGFVSVTP